MAHGVGHQTGIQQHKYLRSEFCNNYTDANGVVRGSWPCSHLMHYQEPHCAICGNEKTASMHIKVDTKEV